MGERGGFESWEAEEVGEVRRRRRRGRGLESSGLGSEGLDHLQRRSSGGCGGGVLVLCLWVWIGLVGFGCLVGGVDGGTVTLRAVPGQTDLAETIQAALDAASDFADVVVLFPPTPTTNRWTLLAQSIVTPSPAVKLTGSQRLTLVRENETTTTTTTMTTAAALALAPTVLDCAGSGSGIHLRDSSILVLQDVLFENCVAKSEGEPPDGTRVFGNLPLGGGAIQLRESASVSVLRGGFVNCGTAYVGGALAFFDASTGILTGAVFRNNQAADRGGVISGSGTTSVRIQSCVFGFNTALEGGVILATEESRWTISGSQFHGNTARYAASIKPEDSAVLNIADSRFENETVPNNGAVAEIAGDVQLTFSNCQFIDNLNVHVSIRASDLSMTTFNNCTFKLSPEFQRKSQSGAAIVISPTLFVGCKFLQGGSPTSGAAILGGAFNLTMIDTVFEDNRCTAGGAALALYRGVLKLQGCRFRNNRVLTSGGAIHLIGGSEEVTGEIDDCEFVGNQALLGGAIQVDGSATVRVTRSRFRKNSATSGGALSLSDDTKVKIHNSIFESNQARWGAALHQNHDSTLVVRDSVFRDNGDRTNTFYGGVAYVPKLSTRCPVFESVRMTGNKAAFAGGAIYFEDQSPGGCDSIDDFLKDGSMSNNEALYGKDYATSPSKLVLLDSTPGPLVPSQVFEATLEVRDYFNQTVKGFIDMSVFLRLDDHGSNTTKSTRETEEVIRGVVVRQPTQSGRVVFVDLVFIAEGKDIEIVWFSDPGTTKIHSTIKIEGCDPEKEELFKDDDGQLYCLRIRESSDLVVYLVYIFASLLLFVTGLFQVLLVVFRNHSPIQSIGLEFYLLLTTGVLLIITSLYMWTDVNDAMCSLRVWLLSIGLSLVFGPILLRQVVIGTAAWKNRQAIYSSNNLADMRQKYKPLPEASRKQLALGVLAHLAPVLLVMTIWMIVSPPFESSDIRLRVGNDPLHHTITYECDVDGASGIFAITLIVIHMIVLSLGCIFAYLLRRAPAPFNESKMIVFVMYNTLFMAVGALILVPLFHDEKTAMLIIVAVLILYSCLVVLMLLIAPKLLLSMMSKKSLAKVLQGEISQFNDEVLQRQKQIYVYNPVLQRENIRTLENTFSGPMIHSSTMEETGTGTESSG